MIQLRRVHYKFGELPPTVTSEITTLNGPNSLQKRQRHADSGGADKLHCVDWRHNTLSWKAAHTEIKFSCCRHVGVY